MQIQELFSEAFPIPIHAILAILALIIGAFQLAAAKGTAMHRLCGYIWMALMSIVAITGLFISEIRLIGPFSPIHLLVPLVLWSVWAGWRAVKNGEIERHKKHMRSLYVFALVITGLFTLLPGRAMYRVLFGA